MRIPESVLKFAQGKPETYIAFYDYFNHYRATHEGKTGLVYDQSMSFSEKEDKINGALRKEIVKLAGINDFSQHPVEMWVTNPNVAWATFAVVGAMIDMILPETLVETIGMYTDVQQIGWGDSAKFEISPRDLFVVSKAGRGQRETVAQKQFKGQVTIIPELRQLTVQVSLFRVLAGLESLAEFVMKAVRSLETQMTVDVYNTFNTAMAALPNTATTGLRVAGYTQSDLVSMAQRVTAWNQGAKAMIVGTQLALQDVLPADTNYRYMLDSEYVRIGYVRTAFGYDVLALPQVADRATPWGTVLDDAKIYVISPSSQKLVKLVLEGGSMAKTDQPFDNANLQQNTTLYKSYGQAIVTNATAGVITLS